MDSVIDKFKDDFIEETNGLIDRLEKDLLELENKPGDKDLIESVFRIMHTIKGASSMFGFDIISEFTHQMESLYQLIRENKLQFNKDIFEITFQSVDHIRKLLTDPNAQEKANHQKQDMLLISINRVIEYKPENTMPVEAVKATEPVGVLSNWHILFRVSEAILLQGIKPLNIFHELSSLGQFEIARIDDLKHDDTETWSIFLHTQATDQEIREVFLFVEEECTIVKLNQDILFNLNQQENEKAVNHETDEENDVSIIEYVENIGKRKEQKIVSDKTDQPGRSSTPERKNTKRISVDSSKLDQLMFLVSELITVNSQINLSTRDKQYNIIRPYLEKVDTLSKQFRNNALEIRLVPLGDTVLRFQRLIRDLSKQLGKQINFVTQGTNTELDKNTIDQLTEPLMHIIRNCIDHGIESPEIRLHKGKSEQGTITMAAYNSGNNVFIIISDDGCGIDDEKVRLKAIDKGYLKPNDKPDKKELYDFIFRPGFSTAQNLTEVSGRGVGMDVVKRRINDLRGEVTVDSEAGLGTTFTLKLQQSMSIIDSLLFTVDDSYFTVPISEIAICTQSNANYVDEQRHTSTIPYNYHLIPFIDLRMLFMLSGNYPENLKTIIIQSNEREIALLCDKIIGEHQAVLKPLGKTLRKQEYITAASQMGDGKMAFMIDTSALFKKFK